MSAGFLIAALIFADGSTGRHLIELPVTAPSGIARPIAKGLVLEVRRLPDAHGIVSWEVVARDRHWLRDGNLLYHSRQWHGPYPTMIDPWMIREHYFPNSNDFNIKGYPWRVTVECRDCAVAGNGDDSRLVSGTIRVRWRRR